VDSYPNGTDVFVEGIVIALEGVSGYKGWGLKATKTITNKSKRKHLKLMSVVIPPGIIMPSEAEAQDRTPAETCVLFLAKGASVNCYEARYHNTQGRRFPHPFFANQPSGEKAPCVLTSQKRSRDFTLYLNLRPRFTVNKGEFFCCNYGGTANARTNEHMMSMLQTMLYSHLTPQEKKLLLRRRPRARVPSRFSLDAVTEVEAADEKADMLVEKLARDIPAKASNHGGDPSGGPAEASCSSHSGDPTSGGPAEASQIAADLDDDVDDAFDAFEADLAELQRTLSTCIAGLEGAPADTVSARPSRSAVCVVGKNVQQQQNQLSPEERRKKKKTEKNRKRKKNRQRNYRRNEMRQLADPATLLYSEAMKLVAQDDKLSDLAEGEWLTAHTINHYLEMLEHRHYDYLRRKGTHKNLCSKKVRFPSSVLRPHLTDLL
jgi:hypothetical protein